MYDILGKETATLVSVEREPGEYAVSFDATSIQSGIYFYRLMSGGNSITKKNDGDEMISSQMFRTMALSFHGSEEMPHFEKISFRVMKKIFATLDEKIKKLS